MDRLTALILELQQLSPETETETETPLDRSEPIFNSVSVDATLQTICELLVVPANFVLPEYEISECTSLHHPRCCRSHSQAVQS